MMLRIPEELQSYVRMSKKAGLIHSDDMPLELMPLFETTRKNIIESEQERKQELEKLLKQED